MIIEIHDILGNSRTVTHAKLPRGMTLGQVFDADSRLRLVAPCVIQVKINGVKIDGWKDADLGNSDTVVIDIAPTAAVGAFFAAAASAISSISIGTAISLAIAGLSIIQFAISLFNTPKPTKLATTKDSPTYSFDGIKTSFSPGGPVPVIYGEHLTGGQLLGMAVDVSQDGRQQQLSMLIGLGVGPITDVNCVRLNNIPISNFSDTTTWEWRAGQSSQAPIMGFEQVRNTFADGREVGSPSPIIYTSVGNEVDAIQLQIAALEGLGMFFGGTSPRLLDNSTQYSIEYAPQGTSSWTIVESPRNFTGRSRAAVWDAPTINFGSRSAWDVRLLWLGYTRSSQFKESRGDAPLYRIWLRNVTEITDRTEAYSGTATLAIKAVATNQLQGGAPTVTAMVQGRPVQVYTSIKDSELSHTRNPAWCVLDYMTNSVYGMGAFIPTSAINIQSFFDFATLCNSLVSDGAGSLEPQHVLDIVMDKKKPHWAWIQELLGLYRSSMIYSQGQFKIITDRGDLPIRQIFHAGNIVPGTFKLTIGANDPIRPNQATVTFPNQHSDYNLDTIYAQNSASVLGANEPIKEFDLSLIGITRESEALREAHWQLSHRRQTIRESTFSTGLEALAVEPGDQCKVGVVTTNFELGYGGRLLEGSIFHLVLDREIEVRSGYPYELYLWHIGADSMETRTVATTPGSGFSALKTIVVSPTNPFNITPNPNDRWAIGISSEDLMRGWVKKISRDSEGRHELTVEQYIPTNPITPVLVSTPRFGRNLNDPPPQPISVVGTAMAQRVADGTIDVLTIIDVVPAPLHEGGQVTGAGCATTMTLHIVGSHAPINNANNQDVIRMLTGASCGHPFIIASYTGNTAPKVVGVGHTFRSSLALSQVQSGDYYSLEHRGGDLSGFDIYTVSTSIGFGQASVDYAYRATVLGTQYEHTSDADSFVSTYKMVPFSTRGARNNIGNWLVHIDAPGPTGPSTPSGLAIDAGHVVAGSSSMIVPLNWNDNPDSDLAAYIVYRAAFLDGFGSASPVGNIRASQFLDVVSAAPNTLPNFSYWIRAINTSSIMSPVHPSSSTGVSIF